jgi:hypothetical protein
MTEFTFEWSGPFTRDEVIERMRHAGTAPLYDDGEDYGLYQIYGTHILFGPESLLYVGKATEQTFSQRFRQHRAWLDAEAPVHVYLGRTYVPGRHDGPASSWAADVAMAERVIIYKYSPPYNSSSVAEAPVLPVTPRLTLHHTGEKHRLEARDVAPDDWL